MAHGKSFRPLKAGNGHGGSSHPVLRVDDLNETLARFRDSKLRIKAHAHISGRVDNFNLKLPFKRNELRDILGMAVEIVMGEGGNGEGEERGMVRGLFEGGAKEEEVPEMAS